MTFIKNITTNDDSVIVKLIDYSGVDEISAQLLETPYQANCLGEGCTGLYDQNPLYRFDRFDCLTYVNTVIALARSQSLGGFEKNMAYVGYKEGKIAYSMRHHFMSVDWNYYNQRLGLVKDVTEKVLPDCIEHAECFIDKPGWYRVKTIADIKLQGRVDQLRLEELLESMHAIADEMAIEYSRIPFISIKKLFSFDYINKFIQAMPEISVVEIVRPSWNLKKEIGTHLNVSHLGFVFKTKRGLRFRHASEIDGRVVECDLVEYLESYQDHLTVKGIHILAYLG